MLEKGIKAPNFKLKDKDGNEVSLEDFLGKKVIVYFYPKDNTSGCTKEALNYKENYNKFIGENAVVIGISKDSQKSHEKFIEKYQLPFILLSDESLETIKAYDVWHEKKLYGKPYMGVVRTTYIIDEKGYIIDSDNKVNASTNAEDVLCTLKKLWIDKKIKFMLQKIYEMWYNSNVNL